MAEEDGTGGKKGKKLSGKENVIKWMSSLEERLGVSALKK